MSPGNPFILGVKGKAKGQSQKQWRVSLNSCEGWLFSSVAQFLCFFEVFTQYVAKTNRH